MAITDKNTKHKVKTKEAFRKAFIKKVEEVSGEDFSESTTRHQYEALAELVMEEITAEWAVNNSRLHKMEEKQIYFFSIEFLIGRLLKAYVNNLGWDTMVEETLDELGVDYEAIQAEEHDPALGNGGLGRLMACFLDSTAALGFRATAMASATNTVSLSRKLLTTNRLRLRTSGLKTAIPSKS